MHRRGRLYANMQNDAGALVAKYGFDTSQRV
jgi:hypothetical protein